MGSPFKKDNREFWKINGNLISFDAGYDPTSKWKDATPATETDWIARQEEKASDAKPFISLNPFEETKVKEFGRTVNQEIGRTALAGLQAFDKAGLALTGLIPGGDALAGALGTRKSTAAPYSPQADAPSLYTDEALRTRERNPGATIVGQGFAQLPLALGSGGTSLPSQLGIGAARSAASGTLTELNESVTESRPFDPELAAYDGAVAGLFEGASIVAPVLFKKAGGYFQNRAMKAYERGLDDASLEPLSSPYQKNQSFTDDAIGQRRTEFLKDTTARAEEALKQEDELIFSEKSIKKQLSNNTPAQVRGADLRAMELQSAADTLAQEVQVRRAQQTAEVEWAAEHDALQKWTDEVEQDILNKKKVGSGEPELAVKTDRAGTPNQEQIKQQRIDEFRRRQHGIPEEPYNPSVTEFPPVPDNQKQFGVQESDFFTDETEFLSQNGDMKLPPPGRTPHGLSVDEAGVPKIDNGVAERGLKGEPGSFDPEEEFLQGSKNWEGPQGSTLDDTPRGANTQDVRDQLQRFFEEKNVGRAIDGPEGQAGKEFDFELAVDPTPEDVIAALRQTLNKGPGDRLKEKLSQIIEKMGEFSPEAKAMQKKLDELKIEIPKHEPVAMDPRLTETFQQLEDLSHNIRESLENPAKLYNLLRIGAQDLNRMITPDMPKPVLDAFDKLTELVTDENTWGRVAKLNNARRTRIRKVLTNTAQNIDPADLTSPTMSDLVDDSLQAANKTAGEALDESHLRDLSKQLMQSKKLKNRKLGARLESELDNLQAIKGSSFFDPVTAQLGRNLARKGGAEFSQNLPIPVLGKVPGTKKLIQGGLRNVSPGYFPSPEAANILASKTKPADYIPEAVGFMGGMMGGPAGALLGPLAGGLKNTYAIRTEILDLASSVAGNNLDWAARMMVSPNYQAVRAIQRGVISAGMASFTGDSPDLRTSYKEKTAILDKFDADPQSLLEEFNNQWADLFEHDPDAYAALSQKSYEALSFIKSKRPQTVGASIMRPDGIPPSNIQMRQFALYYSAATNPSSAVDDFASGRGSIEQMEALRTVWPTIYNRLKSTTLTSILESDEKPSLNQLTKLDTYFELGRDLDGAFSWDLALHAEKLRGMEKPKSGKELSASSTKAAVAAAKPAGIAALDNPQSVYS